MGWATTASQTLAPTVGRADDIRRVADALAGRRLLSVVGPGGVGKTRLAAEVARVVGERYADGVRTARFASLRDPSLLVEAVSTALGLPRTGGKDRLDALAGWLRDRELLLVMDNCEHVLAQVSALAGALLPALPGLSVLTTSREPLLVAGEAVFWLQPLAVPPSSAPAPAIETYPSVRLFLERARARDHRFEIGSDQWPLVGELCRRLDGLPLAVELAAGRVASVGLRRVVERLASGRPLGGAGARDAEGRHATLRAVFEWSEALLDEPERVLLRRLSVFARGFDIASLEEVLADLGTGADPTAADGTGADPTAADLDDTLARLIDKSLVARDHVSGRFSMLETIRQFAARRLDDAAEAPRVARAHARRFLRLAREAGAGLSSGPERVWLERLGPDQGNLRLAMRWALDHDPLDALSAAAALPLFWWARSQHQEGIRWLRQGLDRATGAPAELRAAALFGLGFLWAHDTDDWPGAAGHLDAGIALLAGEPPILGYLLCLRGEAHAIAGEQRSALELTRRGLAILESHPDPWGQAFAVWNLGHAQQLAGDLDRARRCYERMVAIQTEHGSRLELMIGLNSLAELAEQRGDLAEARTLFERALVMRRDLGAVRLGYVHGSLARSLLSVARVGAALGDRRAAASSLAEATPAAEQMRDTETVAACRALAAALSEAPTVGVLRRDGAGWLVRYGAERGHVADAKGVRHLHELLARPHRPIPALTLAGLADGLPREDADAGPMLDGQALSAYRRRLDELAAECDAADRAGDPGRMQAADAERAALLAELARATGLAGRVRRAGSGAERARLNVTRTLRDAIARIGRQCPALGAHLSEAVTTGTQCLYAPARPTAWRL